MLQPLSRVFECNVDFSGNSFPVVEKEIFVFPAVFASVLSFLSRFGVIQNYIYVRTLTKTKKAHCCSLVKRSPVAGSRWKCAVFLMKEHTVVCSRFAARSPARAASQIIAYFELQPPDYACVYSHVKEIVFFVVCFVSLFMNFFWQIVLSVLKWKIITSNISLNANFSNNGNPPLHPTSAPFRRSINRRKKPQLLASVSCYCPV